MKFRSPESSPYHVKFYTMPLLIDLNFHSNTGFKDVRDILEKQKPALEFSNYMENDVLFIKHTDIQSTHNFDKSNYIFFRKENGLLSIPLKTYLYIRKLEPKIILVQGFIFPFQLLLLLFFLPKRAKIIVQHHGEVPFTGLKLILQRLSLNKINACLFTSIENSIIWRKKKVIRSSCPCFEVLEASTDFTYLNKRDILKKQFGMKGNFNYLWVGRLNSNKDPLTVIEAFSEYHQMSPDALLFMIFQDEELLPVVKELILVKKLSSIVHLVGTVPHNELETWYNAADFYVSGSYKESTGYALIEAMACGCIPIVTDIASFRKITGNGAYGFLYEPGNKTELITNLKLTLGIDPLPFRKKIVEHFKSGLSYQSIANDLDKVCNLVLNQ